MAPDQRRLALEPRSLNCIGSSTPDLSGGHKTNRVETAVALHRRLTTVVGDCRIRELSHNPRRGGGMSAVTRRGERAAAPANITVVVAHFLARCSKSKRCRYRWNNRRGLPRAGRDAVSLDGGRAGLDSLTKCRPEFSCRAEVGSYQSWNFMFSFGRDLRYLSLELGHTNRRRTPPWWHHLDDIVFAFHLRPSQQTMAAARCPFGRANLRPSTLSRAPVGLKTFTRTATRRGSSGDGDRTGRLMNEIARIAFASCHNRVFNGPINLLCSTGDIYGRLSCMTDRRIAWKTHSSTLEAVPHCASERSWGSIPEELCRILREAAVIRRNRNRRGSNGPCDRALDDRLSE